MSLLGTHQDNVDAKTLLSTDDGNKLAVPITSLAPVTQLFLNPYRTFGDHPVSHRLQHKSGESLRRPA